MQFANQRWFDDPLALLEARGARRHRLAVKPDGTLDWQTAATSGGIVNPRRVEIMSGLRMVRFGNILPHFAAAGGWWLEQSAYDRVELFANRCSLSIQVALRLLCCVPAEWGDLNVVLYAQTIAPLLAYHGGGGPVYLENDDTKQVSFMAVTADANGNIVPQLFIPGLGSGDVRREALLLTGSKMLPPERTIRIT